MIDQSNLKEFLMSIGFQQNAGYAFDALEKSFGEDIAISVDFTTKQIIYPTGIEADRDTTKNFSHNENFVVLECVCQLLKQGYRPKQIVLEPKTPGGREDSNFYCDILLRNNNNEPYMLIECKTAGEEFEDAWNKTKQDGGQLFRYYNSYRKAQYLCLYSSNYIDGNVKRTYHVIKMTDNDGQQLEDDDKLSYTRVSSENGNYKDYFRVWSETYEKDDVTSGAFEDNIPAFGVGKRKYTASDDLQDVDTEEIKKKYNEFAVILRQHNVGSHENAFDKLVNLFLAKVVDEANNPEDLQFYWKGVSYDDDYSLQDRLQRLYRDGMKKFLEEDVTYIENSEIDKAFRWVKKDLDATKRTIKDYFRQLKFFSDNDFSFISVHNKRLFQQNAIILRKVVKMLQNIRLRTDEGNQNQLLGDLFEGFLNKGVKQSEGQFFTPMPIVRFIVSSLPLERIIRDNPDAPLAIDYACGAGHFLTEYDFRITEYAKKYHPEIPLSEYFSHTIGIEKEYRLSKVSKVSAFMYGHDETKIIYADALDHIEGIKDNSFDVLVANPPYAVSGFLETLSDKVRKKYSLYNSHINLDKNNAIETFFIERSALLMKSGGVAGIILPFSVLSKDGIFTRMREIILKNFDLISLVKLEKNTFGKTNTSTVTMFLRRKETNTPESCHFYGRVENWFNANHEADEAYQDTFLLEAYCNHMGYELNDYRQFLNGHITDSMASTEVMRNYHESFFGTQRNAMKGVCDEAKKLRAKFRARKMTATFKHQSEEEKQQATESAFYDFAKAIEKDKVYYFILAYNAPCPVVLVNMPSGTSEGKKFLGYEWSDTKGNEGIKYLHIGKGKKNNDDDDENDGNEEDDDTMQQIRGINGIVTPLFNPADLDDSLKINTLIRQNFLGVDVEIPNDLEPYVSIGNLVDMLDFKSTAFKKDFRTNVSLKVEVESKYPIIKLKDYCEQINPSKEELHDYAKDTVVSFVDMPSMGFGKIDHMEDKTINELSGGGYTFFKEGDVLLAKISPSMENGKCGMAIGLTNGLGLGSTEFHVIRGKSKAQSKFILEYLNRDYIRKIAASNETGASGHRRVPEYFYAQLPIPNVPQNILIQMEEKLEEEDKVYEISQARIDELQEQKNTITKIDGKLITLRDFSQFSTERSAYSDIAPGNYIATDNMLQNCEGVTEYNGEPNIETVVAYHKGDILLSNIRPYLKKLWLADRDGGCSPDVLVLHVDRSKALPEFVYYSLRRDEFFDFIMSDVKGLKMPRGKKETIERFQIVLPDMDEQQRIVAEVSAIDKEIRQMRTRMQECAANKQAILDKYLK